MSQEEKVGLGRDPMLRDVAGEIRQAREKQAAWAQEQAKSAYASANQCATSAARPRIWNDPRGWAHDICAHHAPDAAGIERIQAIRAAAENLINEVLRSCPDCSDRHQAIGAARMAMMFANASIALDGRV